MKKAGQTYVLHSGFFQVGITALANLTAKFAADDHPRTYFSLEKVYIVMDMYNTVKNQENLQEIIPFVWDHWDIICTKRSKAGSWRNNLATKLVN